MSKFHESVRELLEEINSFLCETLCNEVLSTAAITQKEKLLMKLKCLHSDYPQLQLSLSACCSCSTKSELATLPPNSLSYIDMQVGNTLQKKQNNNESTDPQTVEEKNYDAFNSEKLCKEENSLSLKSDTRSQVTGEKKHVGASESQLFEKSGFLEKKGRERFGGLLNPTHKRWYCVQKGLMCYYEKPTDKVQRGVIPLAGYEVRTVPYISKDLKKNNFCFEIVCPGKPTYQFFTYSEEELKLWITVIENNSTLSSEICQKTFYQQRELVPRSNEDEDIYEEVDENNYKDAYNEESSAQKSNETGNKNSIIEDVDIMDYYIALWDCIADDQNELKFNRGDIIHILSKEYDSYAWWFGECQGRIGFVPKSYLMEAYETY